ncbi:glycine/D-amino acid oxidase-like deaminating enzyme [Silvibacterium bohemicum]|uniref:Glycine/D-amino acid oxidase-like deaminating enzyme n=1 Tax=Silvibacterium bohemicum TaxID=1577686 RepID=A0A841JRA2_9BACT|nr:FAD-dependent oxidoreductase [Silvibacterium bohemicum]MBB6143922.1 glycine/D-amino acid oxidase-like deaminating enzyme [Silvibacterium bohemicum]
MSATYDVVVIGAGIVGAACAAQFAAEGLRVLVVERDSPASGATGAAMGHVVVMDNSVAQLALTRYSQQLWHALSASLPSDIEYDRCGTLWLAADEAEMEEVRRKHKLYADAGIPSQILDTEALAEAEPNLRPLHGALLAPEDAVLSPPHATAYLIATAQQHGAEILPGKSVTSVRRGEVTLGEGTKISAAHIVIANGVAAVSLLPKLPIKPRKGHLVLAESYPGYAHHQLVELGYLQSAHSVATDSVAFNVQPRRSGQLLIGSSRQYTAMHPEIDAEILDAMLQRADEYMPGLSKLLQVRAWTGFRAATPDKLPLIGPTEDATLLLATGHEGLGITTSLATAHLLADTVLQRPSKIGREPYLPSRFMI